MCRQHGTKGERESWLFQLPRHGWKSGKENNRSTKILICILFFLDILVHTVLSLFKQCLKLLVFFDDVVIGLYSIMDYCMLDFLKLQIHPVECGNKSVINQFNAD